MSPLLSARYRTAFITGAGPGLGEAFAAMMPSGRFCQAGLASFRARFGSRALKRGIPGKYFGL